MNSLIEFIMDFVLFLTFWVFDCTFFERRFKSRADILFAYTAWYVAGFTIRRLFNVPITSSIYFNIAHSYLSMLLVSVFCFRGSLLKKMSLTGIFQTTGRACEMIIFVIMAVFSPISLQSIYSDANLLLICISAVNLLNLLMAFFVNRVFHKTKVPESKFVLIIMFSFSFITSIITPTIWSIWENYEFTIGEPTTILVLLLTPFLLFSGFAYLYILDKLSAQKELEMKMRIRQEQVSNQAALICQHERNMNDKNNLIHDYKNNVLHLAAVIDKPGTAQVYCDELIAEYTKQLEHYRFETGNDILDTILSKFKYDCEQSGTNAKFSFSYHDFSFLSPLDTSALFGNLFDNALAACGVLDDKRWVRVSSMEINGLVCVTVSNSYGNDVKVKDGTYLSARRNYSEKGRGVDIIKSVAMKYEGDLGISYNNDEFSAAVWLKA